MTYLIEIDNNSRSYLERGYENIKNRSIYILYRLSAPHMSLSRKVSIKT